MQGPSVQRLNVKSLQFSRVFIWFRIVIADSYERKQELDSWLFLIL